jgi:branched-chain amino acid transport system substrate-binding protein
VTQNRRVFLGLTLLTAALSALACDKKSGDAGATAGSASGAPATGDIPVGAFFSLSGEETQFGKDSTDGINLATDEINAKGGVKGRKIKLIIEDDKSNPQEATQKVRQLIDRNHVVALLGEVASSRSLSGGLIANQSKIPMISPSSTNVKVTMDREYVFRVCFTDDAQGVAAAEFVTQKLGKKKIAILYAAQDPYSSGLAASFKEGLKKFGGEVVIEKGYQKGEKNFRTHLGQLMGAHPDVIYVPNYYTDMVPIAQQAAEAKIPGSMFVGGDGWDSEDLLKGAGKELEGAFFTNHYAPDVPWENSKKFVADYKARYAHEPSSLAAQAYDAAKLLYDAMGRATAIEPKAIRDAIAETKGFLGATGTISIDQNRNADKPLVVVQIKGGKLTYHATVNEKK